MGHNYIIKKIMNTESASNVAIIKKCQGCGSKKWFYENETLLICSKCRGN